MNEPIDLMTGLSTARSIRRFKTDPIPAELLRTVLEAATWAPSGSNSQGWRLLVVRDPEKRRQIGEIYRRGFFGFYPRERLQDETDPTRRRIYTGAIHLADTMGTDPPVLVMFCGARPADSGGKSPSSQHPWTRGSSIYLAVQNLLLAARASGLGGCLTTVHLNYEAEAKAVLGIPDDYDTFALVPLGYPIDRFGPLSRKPVEEVTYFDDWGAAPPPVA